MNDKKYVTNIARGCVDPIFIDNSTQNFQINVCLPKESKNKLPFIGIKTKIDLTLMNLNYFPTYQDFISNNVIISKENKDSAFHILNTNNELGIMGEGISGKTTFSLVVGNRYSVEGYEVLYLDFKENQTESILKEIMDIIYRYGDKKLLIIFDNIHLFNHSLDLYQEIRKSTSVNFKVIYVGRKVYPTSERETNFFKAYISKIKGQFVHLKTDSEVFSDIYNYFSIKYNQKSKLSKDIFEVWAQIFRNELDIFSWALYDFYKKNKKLPFSYKELNSKHVESIVEVEYLTKAANENELDKLINLCMIAQLDLYAPVKKLFENENEHKSILTNFRKEGIVFEFPDEKNERQIGMLNPRLAKLILNVYFEGNKNPENKQKELNKFIEIMRKVPEMAPSILRRLKIYKNLDMPYILKELYKDDEYIQSVLNSNHCLTYSQLLDAEEYYPDFRIRFLKIIKDTPSLLLKLVADFKVADLMNFIKYIYVEDINLAEKIITITQKNFKKILLKKCIQTSLHELAGFLLFLDKTKSEVAKDVSEYIINNLTDKNNDYNIFDVCLSENTDLEYLSAFLDYSKDKNKNFFDEIIKTLSDRDYRNTLIKRALITFNHNPQFLTNFLKWFKEYDLVTTQELMVSFVERYKEEIINKLKNTSTIKSTIFLNFLNDEGLSVRDFSHNLKQFDFESIPSIIELQKKLEFLDGDAIVSSEFKKQLSGQYFDKLIKIILKSSLIEIVSFFKYLDLPDNEIGKILSISIRLELSKNYTKEIVRIVVNSPYDQLKTFITYLDGSDTNGQNLVNNTLKSLRGDNIRKLTKRNLQYALSRIKYLDYLFNKDKEFAKLFFKTISEDYYLKSVIKQCCVYDDLGKITDILRYLDNLTDESGKFSNLIQTQLKKDEYFRLLIEKCLKSTVDRLTKFLEYLDDVNIGLSNLILYRIFSEEYAVHLKKACIKTPPYQLVYFLKYFNNRKYEEKREDILKWVFEEKSEYLDWFKILSEPLLTNFYWHIQDNFDNYSPILNKFMEENSLPIPKRKVHVEDGNIPPP